MKHILLLLLLCFSLPAMALEKLKQEYLVAYGNPEAKIKLVQFYSFTCPHCMALFRKEFQKIKSSYIETNKIYWVFHPVPMDILTIQGMACLEKLSQKEKKIFLEAILEEIPLDDMQLSATLMQKAMEILEKPIPGLKDKTYLTQTQAFQDSFHFIKEQKELEALPSIEINGEFLSGVIPDQDFLKDLTSNANSLEVHNAS